MNARANVVDVDPLAIDQTLGQLDGEPAAPADASGVEPELAEVRLQVDWAQALDGAVELLAKIVAPNWQLTDEEKSLLVSQGSKTLEAFWPHLVLEGKWLALFMFSVCAGTVALKRFDSDSLTFRPLRAAPAPAADDTASRPVEPPLPADKNRVVAAPWVGRGA